MSKLFQSQSGLSTQSRSSRVLTISELWGNLGTTNSWPETLGTRFTQELLNLGMHLEGHMEKFWTGSQASSSKITQHLFFLSTMHPDASSFLTLLCWTCTVLFCNNPSVFKTVPVAQWPQWPPWLSRRRISTWNWLPDAKGLLLLHAPGFLRWAGLSRAVDVNHKKRGNHSLMWTRNLITLA